MRLLDPYSLVLMAGLIAAVLSAVLFFVRRSFQVEIPGLGFWAWGLAVQVLSAFVYALRGVLPDAAVLPLANVLFILGHGLPLIGLQVFFGRPPGWMTLAGALAFTLVGMLWWLLVEPDYAARVVWVSVPMTLINCLQLWQVVRHGRGYFASWFLGTLIGMNTLLVASRAVLALMTGPALVDLTRPGHIQNVYLALTGMIPNMMAVAFLMMSTRRAHTAVERRSASDPLTGVLNRRGFGEAYARETARMRRLPRPLSLLAIDLDFFKRVNDLHGHAEGDRVLVEVARMVASVLRESDYVARFGGEEFMVLLPDTDLALAVAVAERIQGMLRSECSSERPACTASIGVAWQDDPLEGMKDLLDRGDQALYRAKANGRDRIETSSALASESAPD